MLGRWSSFLYLCCFMRKNENFFHFLFTRTTSQSPRLRETLATVAITRGNSRSVFSLVDLILLFPSIPHFPFRTFLSMKSCPNRSLFVNIPLYCASMISSAIANISSALSSSPNLNRLYPWPSMSHSTIQEVVISISSLP